MSTTSKLVAVYNIWKKRNYEIQYFIDNVFQISIDNLKYKASNDNILSKKYRAIFVPVGYSIENILLISAILNTDYIRYAKSESSKMVHTHYMHIIEEKIKSLNPKVNISEVMITYDDQKHIEQKISEWIDEMKNGYGIPYREMAIDLTGGTKPMSIGAHNAAMSFDEIDAFYLKTDYDLETKEPMPGTERLIKVKKTRSQVDEKMVFVAMPFKDELKQVYEKSIKVAIDEIGMKCIRVDEEVFTGPIVDKINDNILKANVIIAELTEYNPNVYYELGLAHGNNKKVIMLTQDISKIPFDLRHLRIVKYENDKLDSFKEQLKVEIHQFLTK